MGLVLASGKKKKGDCLSQPPFGGNYWKLEVLTIQMMACCAVTANCQLTEGCAKEHYILTVG
jgi:hypothetical protein